MYNWYIWFWTQQVRHGSLTRQSSHRSSYKIHRRHRSVSSSILPFLLPFLLYISELYNRGRLRDSFLLHLPRFAQIYIIIIIILFCYRFILYMCKSKKALRFQKKTFISLAIKFCNIEKNDCIDCMILKKSRD